MKIEAFGAFVEMAGTRFQGLVHISQLAKDRVENINEVVTVNDEVFVKVKTVHMKSFTDKYTNSHSKESMRNENLKFITL